MIAPADSSRFPDLHPPLGKQAALVEANRCLFCFDAPCAQACPTHIDVPRFIKKIASGNLPGSAKTILEANILGASCARVCPVQVLCEGACVLNEAHEKPIEIGRLQRFAMDAFAASAAPLPFTPAAETDRSVALIGAGPASLACAAELRLRGIRAVLYDARPLPGGLNTYGVAEYKLPLTESLREIEMLRQLGVEFHFNTKVDAANLERMEQQYDAIFLGIGLGGIYRLGIPGESLPGVTDALELIAGYKSGEIKSMTGRVAVIGAGNTAIDAAIAAVRLGADEVSIVYRRGVAEMSAFPFEYEHALREGVRFLWNLQPVRIAGDGKVESLELIPFEGTGQAMTLDVDTVVLSIGQATHSGFLQSIHRERGRIVIDRATGQTSYPKFFAGGDCTNGGREVVDAVADGRRAALGIAAWLEAQHVYA
jgi:glutamate synthase (NADPH/NADH) small chain